MTKKVNASVTGLTDIGQLRKANEDSILVDQSSQLYAIADGMGGHGSGDVASKLALETLQQCLSEKSVAQALASEHVSDEQALSLVFQCIGTVNKRIYQENLNNNREDGTGMGTTLVGLCFYGQAKRAIAFNIGDSRLYAYDNNELKQLTTDHTMYRVWIENGRVGPAPPPNLIVRAVGLFEEVDIDLEVMDIEDNTSYLLCSDGLSGMISDKDIATQMAKKQSQESLCKALVHRANEKGGHDNISVIVYSAMAEK